MEGLAAALRKTPTPQRKTSKRFISSRIQSELFPFLRPTANTTILPYSREEWYGLGGTDGNCFCGGRRGAGLGAGARPGHGAAPAAAGCGAAIRGSQR